MISANDSVVAFTTGYFARVTGGVVLESLAIPEISTIRITRKIPLLYSFSLRYKVSEGFRRRVFANYFAQTPWALAVGAGPRGGAGRSLGKSRRLWPPVRRYRRENRIGLPDRYNRHVMEKSDGCRPRFGKPDAGANRGRAAHRDRERSDSPPTAGSLCIDGDPSAKSLFL